MSMERPPIGAKQTDAAILHDKGNPSVGQITHSQWSTNRFGWGLIGQLLYKGSELVTDT